MTAAVLLMADFNGDQVSRYFDLPREYTLERDAMSFVFQQMKDEIPQKSKEDLQESAKMAIADIEFRFSLYNTYSIDFFQGYEKDPKALVVAVICGKRVEQINGMPHPYEFERNEDIIEGPVLYRHDMDDDIALRACILYDEAGELINNGATETGCEYSDDVVFLAHILVFEKLRAFMDTIEEYDEDELLDIQANLIPKARSFLRTDTLIGENVSAYIDFFMQETQSLDVEEETPQQKKPTLIYTAPEIP